MSRHKNRTLKGDQLIIETQERFDRWWLGKYIDHSPTTIDGILAKGKVLRVEYIGNSVYGVGVLHLDNGCKYTISGQSFKPRKSDVNVIENLK